MSDNKPMTHYELVERAVYWLKNSMKCLVVLSEQGKSNLLRIMYGCTAMADRLRCMTEKLDGVWREKSCGAPWMS
jgi:hypothetical protein